MNVPEGWTLCDLEDLAHVDLESLSDKMPRNFLFYYLDISAVTEGQITFPDVEIAFAEAPSRARRVVHRNDVLMSTVRPNLKAFAYFDHESGPFIASTGFAVLTAKLETDSRFLLYSILSDSTSRQIDSLVIGSNYPAINPNDVRHLQILAPPQTERNKIGQILSTVDAAIHYTTTLIEKKQRVKAGLMRALLSRGVDAQGTLRSEHTHPFAETPAGRVPANWSSSTLEHIGKWHSGGTPSRENPAFWGEDVSWLCPKDMKSFDVATTSDKLTRIGLLHGSREVPASSVFIVVRGMILAHTFPVTISSVPMAFNQDVKAIVTTPRIEPRFLAYWFVANGHNLLKITTTATHGTKRFDMNELFAVPIAFPKKDEQVEIVKRLDAAAAEITTNINIGAALRRLRTGLMQSLLTGRKRVTGLLAAGKDNSG